MMEQSRRKAVKNMFLGASAIMTAPAGWASSNYYEKKSELKGNINHSVCRWTYGFLSLDQLCLEVKKIGFSAIDLIGPKEWPILKANGIYSSMCNGAEISLTKGWNDKQYHPVLIKNYLEYIDLVSTAGYKNLICFTGSRNGMDDDTGMKNCIEGLKQILSQAEKNGVMIVMELLNSKIDHKDYMCDHTRWGVELCRKIGSPNFTLLYDIYHMQINEGDVIRTIKDNHQYIGHYHTGGVPGRHEINESQELYYPAILQAIKETGFKDFVAQEFTPTGKDKLGSLKEAIRICDV